ncbi:MAG: ATP-binding protein [Longimicrobiales bacterium]|nr:ATP-binding protein [Longimicrobiales bacterium]
MSLHRKVVLLFLGVAVLPLLVFALVARGQSLELAGLAARAEAANAVADVVALLEEEAEEARRGLAALAVTLGEGGGVPAPDSLLMERILAAGSGPAPAGFVGMALEDASGAVRATAGLATGSTACVRDRFSTPVSVRVPLPDGSGTLVGTYRPGLGAGIAPVGAGLRVFDGGGEIVLAVPCAQAALPVPAGLNGEGGGAGAVDGRTWTPAGILEGDGEGRFLAYARGDAPGWTAVAVGTTRLRARLAALFRAYWLFLVGLAATAVLAFAILVRPVTGALHDLTLAAERVAGGDLRPWLPTPRRDEVGRLTLAFAEMTDRMRETLAHAEKTGRLALLGKLSAYLAHEIRNPLSSVRMNLQRLDRWRRAGEIPERCGTAISTSLEETDRLTAAVTNVLQLAPGKPRPRQRVALHDLLREVESLLRPELGRGGVTVTWALDAHGHEVLGDTGQLKGVFINLLLNALHAQPDGGAVHISSRLHPGGAGAPGPLVEVRVRDSGPGVPAGIRDRIFEPFFTTRELGSGIGLAVASQVVRDHGGAIFLEEPHRQDEGAEFVILLPLAAAAPEEGAGEIHPGVPPWLAGEAPSAG